jgi:hypothetical protein
MKRRTQLGIGLAALILVATAPSATAAESTAAYDASPFASIPPFPTSGTEQLRPGAERRIAAIKWLRTASAGATVLVSPAYAGDPSAGDRWAQFFASLIHGSELGLLTAYIATPAEIDAICPEPIGCYSGNRLWVSEEPSYGISPQAVAAHEYGHHVADNRSNPPWIAVDSGTKRWATAMNICSRTRSGTAYPGDEGAFYTLNPGEAFAEAYRVLNGYGADQWDVVDTSFRPTQVALDAVRADVLDPWTKRVTRTVRVHITRAGAWSGRISTPLDGSLAVTTTTGGVDLQLRSADGKNVLVRGSWGSSGGKSVDYQVCGERSFVLRVASAGPRQLNLRVTEP